EHPVLDAAARIRGQESAQDRLIHLRRILIADPEFLRRHMDQIVVVKRDVKTLRQPVADLMTAASELSADSNDRMLHHNVSLLPAGLCNYSLIIPSSAEFLAEIFINYSIFSVFSDYFTLTGRTMHFSR